MKTVGTILAAAFALLPWCSSSLLAQQSTTSSSDKKVVITKRTIDADGTETTETIVKKGQAAENFDVDQYIKDNQGDNVQLDVRVQGTDDDKAVVIKRKKDHSFNWSHSDAPGAVAIACDDNRAFLGVEQDSDEDGDEEGLVVEVVRGAAADKAGLRTNDVILKLNGKAVNEWDELSEILRNAKPGEKMTVTYSRNGKLTTADATLTKRSEVKCDPEACQRGLLGVTNEDEDSEDNQDGVPVNVAENSGAAKAGLQDGDVLLQLNDTKIEDWEDITDFMSYTKPNEKVRVSYLRNGKTNTTEVTLGEQKKSLVTMPNMQWDAKKYNVEVNIREKEACLGVYTSGFGNGDQRGARVSDFTQESAAREATMSTGDVITSVNGIRVTGHDELWDQIAQYKPGEKVAVEYLRDNQSLKVEATLKACRDNSNKVLLHEGADKVREFTLWNWEEKDQNPLRERRVITIRRGAEGDASKVETTPQPNIQAVNRSLSLDGFRAYPNPSQGQVTVEFHSDPVPTIVSLLDVSGRQLFREELNAFNGDYNQQFDLSEYAKGTIIIHVQQNEKVFTEQIIVN
ncbi:MAG: PDZ domain-containing protein [Saprospiraceae bacterium]|nr:PDZ domain-containing protein [Saprospiraceae bacterium]